MEIVCKSCIRVRSICVLLASRCDSSTKLCFVLCNMRTAKTIKLLCTLFIKVEYITLEIILHIALFNTQLQTYLSKSASKDYDDAKKTKAEEAFISFAVSVPNPMDGLRRIDPNMVYQFFQKNLDILKFGLILATFIWSKS